MNEKMFFISKFCLLCLKEDDGKLQDILNKDVNGVTIQEKLDYCVFELISSGHEFPGFICEECHGLLETFYNFKQKCFKSNRKIRNFMDSLKQMHFTGISYRDLSVSVQNMKNFISFETKTKTEPQKNEPKKLAKKTIAKNKIKRSKSQEFPKLNPVANLTKEFSKLNKSLTTESVKLNKSLNTFQCDMCPKLLATKATLSKHLLITHSDNRPHECSLCFRKFKRKDYLTVHMKSVHEQKNYKTPKKIIDKAITKKEKKHDVKVAKKIVNREINQNGTTSYKCGICQTEIMHKHNLKRHFLTFHVEDKDHFDKIEKSNENINDSIDLTDDENLEIITFEDDIIEIKDGEIEEQDFDRRTYNEILLTSNKNTPRNLKNIKHSTPENMFNKSFSAMDHKNCNNLECFVCNKSFSRNAKLSAHMKSHFDDMN